MEHIQQQLEEMHSTEGHVGNNSMGTAVPATNDLERSATAMARDRWKTAVNRVVQGTASPLMMLQVALLNEQNATSFRYVVRCCSAVLISL
jgi:hypothetical protein